MIKPRLDPDEVELEGLEDLVEELETDSEDDTTTSISGSLWRYGSSVASYLDKVYENIEKSEAIASSIDIDTGGIAENVGAWDSHWGRVLEEINDFYSDERFYDSKTRWDGALIPELTDKLEEIDREEYMAREEEVEEIKDIIEEHGPVSGTEVREIFYDRNDYWLTTSQFDSRYRDHIEDDVECVDAGYVPAGAQTAAAD